MSNIDNITSKILGEAEAKAKEILNKAHETEALVIDKKNAEAKKVCDKMISDAEKEAASRIERIISKADLTVRNDKLLAKQKIMEEVLKEAEERLCNLSADEFTRFVIACIENFNVDGDEKIIISSEDKNKLPHNFIEEINKTLVAKNKKGQLSFDERENASKGGFILEKDGIEINCLFSSLISSQKEDLKYGVSKILFDKM